MKLTSCCVCLNHGNNQSGREGYISIHTSLQKLELFKIICSCARNYLTFWLADFMNFMNFISFAIKFIKFKPMIKFKNFERYNYGWYGHNTAHTLKSTRLGLQVLACFRMKKLYEFIIIIFIFICQENSTKEAVIQTTVDSARQTTNTTAL